MDIDITCLEASEYMSDSVDGRLDPRFDAPLKAHLGRCPLCRFDYTLLLGTKAHLREHMKPVAAPVELRRSILASVSDRGASAAGTARPAAPMGSFGLSGWRIPLAFAGALGLALIAFVILTRQSVHNHTRPLDGSVVTESFNNFDQVIQGRLKPAIVSQSAESVRTYLEDKVHFPVQVPSMKEYRLVGGQFSAVDNETTAHVIYEYNGNFIYISQADARRLIGSKKRFIPPSALAELRRSGWYFAGNPADCNLAMWLKDSTLCTAIADINRDLLLANLAGATAP
jgi:anti-sigma factor RsiW